MTVVSFLLITQCWLVCIHCGICNGHKTGKTVSKFLTCSTKYQYFLSGSPLCNDNKQFETDAHLLRTYLYLYIVHCIFTKMLFCQTLFFKHLFWENQIYFICFKINQSSRCKQCSEKLAASFLNKVIMYVWNAMSSWKNNNRPGRTCLYKYGTNVYASISIP